MKKIFVALTIVAVLGGTAGCTSKGSSIPAGLPAPATIVESADSLVTATGTIAGTLELPARAFPVPLVLIIAGSGPTDRNGNSPALPGSNNSLKLLASGLAERGIASLRYDKRGIAASAKAAGREQDIRFTHYIDDARDWIQKLKSDPRFSTVTVVGHSEGSLIGMVAAREAAADGYVSLEGAGRRPRALIVEQLTGQLPPETIAQADTIMGLMEGGTVPDSTYKVPAILYALFRPSVRPYMVSWFKYDPPAEIAKLSIPVLILQGTTDVQVTQKDADALAAAAPGAKVVVVEGMNHVLKNAPPGRAEQMPAYTDPSIPVVPRLLDALADFVKAVKRKSG
ncbi:MAG TPA: alpha/beta fold hydrolase [Gemmatimonadaceae bacterium]|nr:alpha/beta fold hydrolase [Gemmatimonadaceae bacterium]